jgi:hypothetical protein
LDIPWLGVSPSNRKYRLPGKKKALSAKTLLKQEPKRSQWQLLNDEGVRVAFLGQAETTTLGLVTLMMVERVETAERQLCVLSKDTDEATAIARWRAMLDMERPTPENSKLHDMLDLLRKSCAFILAETFVVDSWFLVPWFFRFLVPCTLVLQRSPQDQPDQTGRHQGQVQSHLHRQRPTQDLERMGIGSEDLSTMHSAGKGRQPGPSQGTGS